MAENTAISWTDHTFNIAWGCTKVSPGCQNCYADTLASRYKWDIWGPNKERRVFGEKHWREPLKWNRLAIAEGRSHLVFCSSMCDICEDHPTIEVERAKLWPLVRSTPYLIYQLLTKRADRWLECLPVDWGVGYPNVWLGVSIENNDYIWRGDCLRQIPAVVRFVSYEPALGPLDQLSLTGIDWVIYGGESGSGFRMDDRQWARDMFGRCREAGVAFFHKQSANFSAGRGVELDGVVVMEYPRPRLVGVNL